MGGIDRLGRFDFTVKTPSDFDKTLYINAGTDSGQTESCNLFGCDALK
jgi:hypothetical protein